MDRVKFEEEINELKSRPVSRDGLELLDKKLKEAMEAYDKAFARNIAASAKASDLNKGQKNSEKEIDL